MIKVAIVIPTFNRKTFIQNILNELISQRNHDNINKCEFRIFVVVDGSSDGTIPMINEYYPDVDIIEGTGNWWYTESMNQGFKYALNQYTPDFFLTLNDDIYLDRNYLLEIQRLILNNDKKTIMGSIGITKDQPHRIVTSGNQWRSKAFILYNYHIPFLNKVNITELKGTYESLTLPGRGMLIPTEILQDLNFFESRFKQYHSDGDFTLRALKKGYKVKISWDAKIFVNLATTSSSSSFIKSNFKTFLKSFKNPTSRNYLPSKAKFIFRHGNKVISPITLLIFLTSSFKNFLKK